MTRWDGKFCINVANVILVALSLSLSFSNLHLDKTSLSFKHSLSLSFYDPRSIDVARFEAPFVLAEVGATRKSAKLKL